MEKKLCKRCLLNEVFTEEEYKHMQKYIEDIDKFIKAEENEYRQRLDICKSCDNLINGTCRICGCFVEMRAAIKENYCPNVERYW